LLLTFEAGTPDARRR